MASQEDVQVVEKSGVSSPDLMASSLSDFACFPTENMMSSSTKSQYSQVVFHDLPDVWPTDSDMVCSYSFTDNICPQPGDKIALFKVGWSKVCEYITFQRVSADHAKSGGLSVTFEAQSLPKDDKDFYQLCYVTSGNVIAGASLAFCFRTPNESELVGIEDPYNPGMVIFKSRIACLQSELKKKVEANEMLLVKHELLENNFLILQKEFNKCEEELKKKELKIEELTNQNLENNDKEDELKKLKMSCESFRLMHMSDSAKIEELKKQLDDASVDRKVLEERLNNLQMIDQEKTDEISKLSDQVKSLQSELTTAQETLQPFLAKKDESVSSYENLLHKNIEFMKSYAVLQSSKMAVEEKLNTTTKYLTAVEEEKAEFEKKMKKALADLEKLQKEHDMLLRRNGFLERFVKDKNDVIEGQRSQIENLNKALENFKDTEGSELAIAMMMEEKDKEITELKGKIEDLEKRNAVLLNPSSEEIQVLYAQVESLELEKTLCKRRLDDLIQQFDSMKLAYEGELDDLKKENKELNERKKPSPFSTIRMGLEAGQSAIKQTLGYGEDMDKKYKELLRETSCLRNELAQRDKKYKELAKEKLSLRNELVQTRHEKDELERIYKECKEKDAALQSRVNVLEIELSTAKKQPQNITCPSSMMEQIDIFNKNMPNIISLNSFLAEQTLNFKSEIENEKKKNASLQRKVEDLLQNDAEMCKKLDAIRNTHESQGDREKIQILEEQLAEMRSRLIGTISIESTKRLQEELQMAKQQLSLLKQTLKQKEEEIARLNSKLPDFINSTF